MALGRSIKENPATWIALGVAALLTVPPVRRAIRAATVSAAVGVLKMGDGVKHIGGKVKGETETIMAAASEKRDEWRTPNEGAAQSESWLRKAVVNGLASTLGAADSLTQGVRQTFYKARPEMQMETGAMGERQEQKQSQEIGQAIDRSDGQMQSKQEAQGEKATNPGTDSPLEGEFGEWIRAEIAAVAQGNVQHAETIPTTKQSTLLPESLLPSTKSTTSHGHTGQHVPSGFAVRNPDALRSFAQSVEGVGAGLKPEFEEVIQTILASEDNPPTSS